MGTKVIDVVLKTSGAVKIKKWKVKEGMPLSARQLIMLYEAVDASAPNQLLKYKANDVGTVKKVCAVEGNIVNPGDILLLLEECTHPTVMKDMCAECGADLRQAETVQLNASVPMVHSIPELKVSQELAQTLGKADETRLLSDRKLVLLVDLDQTLIHTTNDNIPPNLKDVVHFQLYGPQSPWYHTRIRPGTEKFLESVSELFELHICTFGARNYAHYIAMFLDPDGRFFSHRILSRDECFDANSKTANLRALFPCGDSMVCIIDDREDVWNYAPNLIHVKPYHFFQHTGDINAPPGLTKKENDTIEEGFDFSKMGKHKSKEVEVEKKISLSNACKKKTDGETTTDKDTEDETEAKHLKANSLRQSIGESSVEVSLQNDPLKDFSMVIEDSSGSDKKETHEERIEASEQVVQEVKSSDKIPAAMVEQSQDVSQIEDCELTEKVEDPVDATMELTEKVEDPVDATMELTEKAEDPVDATMDDHEPGKEDEAPVTEEKLDVNLIVPAETNGTDTEVSTGVPDAKGESSIPPDDINDSNKSKVKCPPDKLEQAEQKKDDDMIEVEDTDDYLLHLEDILRKIHLEYYVEYDKAQNKTSPLPDLKVVIPGVKKIVLAGCHLVLSGLVPSHVPLQRSRAFAVAQSLGATVSAEVTPETTHLVAARAGTAKVNSSRRQKGVHIVTPHWLWHCAERWEKVDERLYPLARGVVTNRHPPAHCGSPQHPGELDQPAPALRPRTDSGRFSDTINPLLTFSSEDMARMDQEVEALCADDDDSESEAEVAIRSPVLPMLEPDTSSCDSLTGGCSPKGWTADCVKAKKRKIDTTTCTESDLEEDSPSAKFRRGEPLPSDLDLGEESQDDTQDSQDADGDDSAWTLMGAKLEREFLSGD